MNARSIPASAAPARSAKGQWHQPLARFLGRSSRFANDEAGNLIKVARDMLVGRHDMVAPTNRRLRRGPPVLAVVKELAELVARSESPRLETDQRFWTLIRDLYTRRHWVSRSPRNLVDTVGVEVDESSPRVKQDAQ